MKMIAIPALTLRAVQIFFDARQALVDIKFLRSLAVNQPTGIELLPPQRLTCATAGDGQRLLGPAHTRSTAAQQVKYGGRRIFALISFSMMLKKGMKPCSHLKRHTYAQACLKAYRAKTAGEDWPELLFLNLVHETSKHFGRPCSKEYAERMLEWISKAAVAFPVEPKVRGLPKAVPNGLVPKGLPSKSSTKKTSTAAAKDLEVELDARPRAEDATPPAAEPSSSSSSSAEAAAAVDPLTDAAHLNA